MKLLVMKNVQMATFRMKEIVKFVIMYVKLVMGLKLQIVFYVLLNILCMDKIVYRFVLMGII